MNTEIFEAVKLIEKEKGIPAEYMLEKIKQALLTAYRKDHADIAENTDVEIDTENMQINMFYTKEVVEEVENPKTQISLEEANAKSGKYEVGDRIRFDVNTKEFGRIEAQTAKQVIIQGIREAERDQVYNEFTSKEHELLTGTVSRIDPRNGAIQVKILSNGESADALLAQSEQVPGEEFTEGDHIKVYVCEVRKNSRGPQVLISRTHPNLVKRLFEVEVPEIFDGTVEINSVAREAGSRTKIAVSSNDANVDPIGACVGPKGGRVSAVVEELNGEKIDIIKYSDVPEEYVAAALAPSDVVSVELLEDGKSCRVVVPDDQLSLAIGKEGQNARLAARLTGFKIDIGPESSAE